ncbi:MAG: proton-conducting transporter membrane subunit [Rikenellaceae bacterium]
MLLYFIIVVLLLSFILLSPKRWMVNGFISLFYLTQAGFALKCAFCDFNATSAQIFTFDSVGVLFFSLLSVVSVYVCVHAAHYIEEKNLRAYKIYNALIIALCTAIGGVYFANHLAVTWIFLELTSICTAALIYFRGNKQALEATWKYIFVCSLGIAVAYLGVLLASSAATHGELSYVNLSKEIASANPLYMKLAFLFMLVGYSSKMEVFPLYTAGIDANSSVPSPISGLLSTGLVNAGFVAIFRMYKIMAASEVFSWCSNVLIVTGVVSLVLAAFFMRRTNNYKRFLSYSTMENMGIVLIGLGVGGLGVYAALVHVAAHTFIKCALMLQIARIGKSFGNYRINRIGDCMSYSSLWAWSMSLGMLAILAFPPSPLFFTELMILREIISGGQWWLLVVITLLVCIVIYSFADHILNLCYKKTRNKPKTDVNKKPILTWSILLLFGAVLVFGLVWAGEFHEFILDIAKFN